MAKGTLGATTLPGRPKVGGPFRLRDLEGRLNSVFPGLFLYQLRPQLFGEWIPNSKRCQYFLSSLGPFLAA